MPKSIKFSRFVYQIIALGQPILVLETQEQAEAYVQDKLRGAEIMILPVAVFAYREERI